MRSFTKIFIDTQRSSITIEWSAAKIRPVLV